jgi:putative heme transporter
VQQVEGNVLEPLIQSHLVDLHPLVVVLAVAAGAITFGVLGAFLAVPVVAVARQVAGILRGGPDDPEVAPGRDRQGHGGPQQPEPVG